MSKPDLHELKRQHPSTWPSALELITASKLHFRECRKREKEELRSRAWYANYAKDNQMSLVEFLPQLIALQKRVKFALICDYERARGGDQGIVTVRDSLTTPHLFVVRNHDQHCFQEAAVELLFELWNVTASLAEIEADQARFSQGKLSLAEEVAEELKEEVAS